MEFLTKEKQNGNNRLAAQDLIHPSMGGGDKAHTFVKPGKDALELLMRTVFITERQAKQFVMLYSKLVKYGFDDGINDLRALMAAKCSVGGRSRIEALMAAIEVLAPSLYTGSMKADGLKNMKNQRQREPKQENDGK